MPANKVGGVLSGAADGGLREALTQYAHSMDNTEIAFAQVLTFSAGCQWLESRDDAELLPMIETARTEWKEKRR